MGDFMDTRKIRIILISILTLVYLALFAVFYSFSWQTAVPSFESTEIAGKKFVQLTGEVKMPGVYPFSAGDTFETVIASAGGLTDNADLSSLDLTLECTDGGKLSIPKKKTVSKTSSGKKTSSAPKVTLPLNLNTASKEDLCALSGVGDAIAARIVEYREQNGPFQSVDDLINVKGIGEKKLEDIRPDVYILSE